MRKEDGTTDDPRNQQSSGASARDWVFGCLALLAVVAGIWDLAIGLRTIFTTNAGYIPVAAAVMFMVAGSLWRATVWQDGSGEPTGPRTGLARAAAFLVVVAAVVLAVPWVLSLLF